MALKRSFLLLCSFIFTVHIYAQLPNGSTAPNWTLTDLNGNTHTLYDYLDQGKTVVIDFSATWCGPCWNYHNSHAIRNFYDTYGPNGTDEAMAFFIEGDLGTNTNCIYGSTGCNNSTWGDWTAGTTYPIISLQPVDGHVTNDYQIGFWPTIYVICPNRKTYEVGAIPTNSLINWLSSCSLDAVPTATDISCFGDGNGAIDLDVSGGRPNISYSWNSGANTQDISNLNAGDYTCTITEGQGHSVVIGPITVDGPTQDLQIQLNDITNLDCYGNANGAIDLIATGGTSSYQYLWNDNVSGNNRNNLDGGNYTVTVTDNNTCTTSASYTVVEPPQLTLLVIATNENCSNSDGTLLLDGDGGTPILFYDIGQGPSPNQYYQNLQAGTYFVTVTDINGCSTESVGVINDTPGPNADAGPDQTIDCSNNIVTLDGTNSDTGPNISYLWTTSNGNIVNGETSLNPSVDAPGSYQLLVTNSDNNCTELASVIVSGDIDSPIADAGNDGILNCLTTNLNLDGTGSSSGANFSYNWSTTNGNIVNGEDSLMPNVDAPGIYSLVVTNTANGCSSSSDVLVSLDGNLPTADAGNDGQLDCNNSTLVLDGSASSSGSNFNYQWSTTDGNIVNGEDSPNPTIDAAGTYSLLVTNTSNGCTAIADAQVLLNDLNPTADAGNDGQLDCNNSTLVLDGSASSSGSNFSYQWSTTNGNIINGEDSPTPTVDAAGNYNLLVTNMTNGCTASSNTQVNLNNLNPVADAGDDGLLNCNINSVTLDGSTSSSGNNFSYQWSTTNGNILNGEDSPTPTVDAAGSYNLLVTNTTNGCTASSSTVVNLDNNPPNADAGNNDAIDCNHPSIFLDGSASSSGNNFNYQWSTTNGNIVNGENTTNPTVDAAGNYNLLVTNMTNGCTANSSVSISEDIDTPTAAATVNDLLTCGINSLTIDGSASSAGSNFSYQWSTTNGNILNGEDGLSPEVNQAGSYTLKVSNQNNGCESSTTVLVDEDVSLPNADASVSGQLDCNNLTIVLNGNSSTSGNLSYQWSTTDGNILNGENTLSPEVDQAGSYNFTVTNQSNACETTVSLNLTQDIDVPFVDAGTAENLNCNINTITLDGTNSSTGAQFNYLWSTTNGNILNGENTLSPTINQAGEYFLQVSNSNNGCQNNASVLVAQTPDLSVSLQNQNNNTCYGDATGSATIDVDGGNPPYDINWSTGVSGETIDNLSVGSYIANIIDEDNCTQTITITITEPDLLAANTSATDVTAAGANDGTAMANPDGGLSPYDYLWNTSATTASINNLAPGSYTLTVSDFNNCKSIETVTISSFNCAIGATINPVQVSCNGGNDGMAAVNILGGTAPFTYQWSNGQTTSTANNLSAGNYTLTLTDDNNCPTTENINITEPAALSINILNQENIDCNGNQNGMIMVDAEGGVGIISYLWESGNTTASETNLAAGNYSVTVTDQNNCQLNQNILITEPSAISIHTTNVLDVDCFGNSTGEITVDAVGGNGNFEYIWENGNAATSSNLVAGDYTVTVLDGNNCQQTATINVSEPDVLAINLESSNDVDCFGNATGVINLSASGGTMDYNYLWENGATTASLTNLVAGAYQVSLSDANACESTLEININQPEALILNLNHTNETALNANDGTASASSLGGTGSYNYLWSTGQTETEISNLNPGNYSVTVTDQNSCVSIETLEVEAFSCAIGAVVNKTNVSCHNLANGTATVDVLIGQAPYSYIWSNGSTEQSINSLLPGDYSVTTTDANNCPQSLSFTITEPEILEAQLVNQTDVSCFGDQNASVNVQAIGGTGSHYYNWSQGGNTNQLNDLAAGNYIVSVSDDNECLSTLEITINQPDILVANANATGETMANSNDGMASATPLGGTSPYQYLWSNGASTQNISNLNPGAYTVTVVDAHECSNIQTVNVNSFNCALNSFTTTNDVSCSGLSDGSASVEILQGTLPYQYIWSNGETTASISNLATGNYGVTVTDDNNCPAYLTFVIDEPDPLSSSIAEFSDVLCHGEASGSVVINVDGGTGAYTYLWSNGSTDSNISNLTAGAYQISVSDENNCSTMQTITIVEPSAIAIQITEIVSVDCADDNSGSANATVSGGTGAYTYLWSNGITDSNVSNLTAGTYELMITDENNCSAIQSFEIASNDSELPQVFTNNQTIYLNNDGQASVNASQIDNGSSDNCGISTLVLDLTNFDCSNLGENTVILTATDLSGNINTAQATVIVEDLINPTINCPESITSSACTNLITYELPEVSDNCVTLQPSLLSGLGSNSDFPVGVNTETYQVMDQAGNTASCSFTITINNTLESQVAEFENTCEGMATGHINIDVSGGTPTYSYQWSNGATDANIDGLSEGIYTITISDLTGCTNTQTVELGTYPAIDFSLDLVNNETANNANGSIEITVSAGTAPYEYEWISDGEVISSEEDPTGLSAGTYICVITDANGCIFTSEDILLESTTSFIDLSLGKNISIFPNPNSGQLFVDVLLAQANEIQISLIDPTGRILTQQSKSNIADHQFEFNLLNYPSGVYFVKALIGEAVIVKKVILLHQQ